MSKTINRNRFGAAAARLVAAAVLAAGLAACSGFKPEPYTELHEIPAGPGLFSGEEGAFVYTPDDRKKKKSEAEED